MRRRRRRTNPSFFLLGIAELAPQNTCHWCHVMERESFEDEAVADYLNAHFVSIKVDREERPDVDAVYMQVCQALTGSGGWPLTVFLAPDKKAFFAGTYFPKNARYGMNGLMQVLSAVIKLWTSDRAKLLRQAGDIAARLRKNAKRPGEMITVSDFHTAFESFRQSFDSRYGGFGRAPKFPTPHNLMFLMRYYYYEGREEALNMVTATLRSMARGGLFDHIGGGFSRYSTDQKWLVPHFEKMLYDNALLVISCLEAYQLTGDEFLRRVAEKTLLYVRREMTDVLGGFYSAQDADSEGEEGKFYTFRPETIKNILGEEDGAYFNMYFGITEEGNFEAVNIPNLLQNSAYDKHDARIDALLPKIYEYRLERTALFKDTKILTAWTALMMAAFATAYRILGTADYRASAEGAATFIRKYLTRPDGRLYVRYRDGDAAGDGYLDDYAFTAWAFLVLYEATFDAEYLKSACDTAETMCRLFEDMENGGYFLTARDAEALLLRPKETYDGALPSGNAVAVWVIVRLSRITAEDVWEERAARQLNYMAADIKEYPTAHSFGLMAAMAALYASREVVAAVSAEDDITNLRRALSRSFLPNTSILIKTRENEKLVGTLAPFTAPYLVLHNKTSFYLCENKACGLPFTSVDTLVKRLTEDHEPVQGGR